MSDLREIPVVQPTRRRWRLSLWGFFALLTVATLIVSHAQTLWQLQHAKHRIGTLHQQFGVARILDSEQPAVMGTRLTGNEQMRFHIYQPPGKRYRLCSSIRAINRWRPSFPSVQYSMSTPDVEEFWVFLDCHESGSASEIAITLQWEGGSSTKVIPVPEDHFVDKTVHRQEVDGNFRAVHDPVRFRGSPWGNPGAPMLVYAMGESPGSWMGEPPAIDGFILWLEEVDQTRSPIE